MAGKEHDLLADVEKQDDQVAESVAQLQHIEPDRTYIPALTDKTFPIETKTRDLLVVFFHATCKLHALKDACSIFRRQLLLVQSIVCWLTLTQSSVMSFSLELYLPLFFAYD